MKPYMRVFLALVIIGLFLGLTKVLSAEPLSDTQIEQLKKAGFSDSEIQKYIESGVRPKIRKLWEEGMREKPQVEGMLDNKKDAVTVAHIVHPYTGEKGSFSLSNGRRWNELNDTQKVVFIAGIWQGVDTYFLFISLKVDTEQEYDRCLKTRSLFIATGFYPEEIAKIVDGIYKDTSNIKIPITKVILVATLKAGGTPSQEVEKLLSDYRKDAAKQNP